MIINLLDIVGKDDNTVERPARLEMNEFHSSLGTFSITHKDSFNLTITHSKDQKLHMAGETSITVSIPCDRCLEPVETKLDLVIDRDVDLKNPGSDDESEEQHYIDGYNLDVDKLLYHEILIGWPMKILCSDTCKGTCSVCGQNLNKGTCDCEDTGLDPRMSVIRDVFKNFKEV